MMRLPVGLLACKLAEWHLNRGMKQVRQDRWLGPYHPYREPPDPVQPRNIRVEIVVQGILGGL